MRRWAVRPGLFLFYTPLLLLLLSLHRCCFEFYKFGISEGVEGTEALGVVFNEDTASDFLLGRRALELDAEKIDFVFQPRNLLCEIMGKIFRHQPIKDSQLARTHLVDLRDSGSIRVVLLVKFHCYWMVVVM